MDWISGLTAIERELTLFAVTGFLIGGLDDLLVDLAWGARTLRRAIVLRRHVRTTAADLVARTPGRLAVFIGAWDESAVIAAMVANTLRQWRHSPLDLFVGIYPNDPATSAALARFDDEKLQIVVNPCPGPTTKADALNSLWRAMLARERALGHRYKAVVLHDAEDVVHHDEPRVYDALIERFALVQLPVLPLIDQRSRWVSGTYLDEFAEHHGKTLLVREEVGAAIPSAGVGCAIARGALEAVAARRGGEPFDADTLTEDYELGLMIGAQGGKTVFVRVHDDAGNLVAVRAHFPATLAAAVRQKARWVAGIALNGWDRVRWQGGVAERWMRLRDRRTMLSALVLLSGYLALLVEGLRSVAWFFGMPRPSLPAFIIDLLTISTVLLAWRLFVRAAFVAREHGWREALYSLPRALIANVIALLAARGALILYLQARRDGRVVWDKTDHVFPADLQA